jgi:dTDP-3-amino-3,4,6-trideoxy-alpha-D-glucose transaminase
LRHERSILYPKGRWTTGAFERTLLSMAETAVRTRVPFLDLEPSHAPLKAALLDQFGELIDSNGFINGPPVAAFERAWAEYCGVDHCVGVASGLDALRLALLAAGLNRGEEVIVPANTFAATFEAVTQAGGVPVPADVRWEDYNIDPDAAAAAVTPRTRFVLPVHLYGQLCDVIGLRAVAEAAGIAIVEDACQAHGATRGGLRAGAVGLAGAFSFYPGKNLGAMGDAGALVTNDAGLAERMRALREHGQRAKYRHELDGYTSRLDTIQAIVLLEKLPLLDAWNDERREVARLYTSSLAGVGDLVLPATADDSLPVWHLYVIRTEQPEALGTFLAERGIATGRHYPEPPHLSQAFASLGHRAGAFPITEAVAAQGLSLPIYPGLTAEAVGTVAAGIAEFFDRA